MLSLNNLKKKKEFWGAVTIFKYPVGEYIMIKIRIMGHINKKESG